MKFIILISAILAVSYGVLDQDFIDKAKAKLHKIGEECATETGVTADDIAEIKAKKTPSRREGKCFMACFQKRMGVLNAEGKLDKASGLEHVDKLASVDADLHGKAKQILEKCYAEVTDDADYCETAYKFGVCCKKICAELGISDSLFN